MKLLTAISFCLEQSKICQMGKGSSAFNSDFRKRVTTIPILQERQSSLQCIYHSWLSHTPYTGLLHNALTLYSINAHFDASTTDSF